MYVYITLLYISWLENQVQIIICKELIPMCYLYGIPIQNIMLCINKYHIMVIKYSKFTRRLYNVRIILYTLHCLYRHLLYRLLFVKGGTEMKYILSRIAYNCLDYNVMKINRIFRATIYTDANLLCFYILKTCDWRKTKYVYKSEENITIPNVLYQVTRAKRVPI